MDPVTIGLFVAANFSVSAFKNKESAKASRSQVQLEVEQAKLQAEEQAYQATVDYKELISFNAALAGMGFGGKTGFTNVASKDEANLNKDLNSAAKQQRFLDISAQFKMAEITANKFTSNLSSGINSLLMAEKMGAFKDKSENLDDGSTKLGKK